jgi:hypothetical protein
VLRVMKSIVLFFISPIAGLSTGGSMMDHSTRVLDRDRLDSL